MIRVSGTTVPLKKASQSRVLEASLPLSAIGASMDDSMNRITKAQRASSIITNGKRPSNLLYRTTNNSNFWYMYAIMDWYRSEVSVLSTICMRPVMELFRHGIGFVPKFAYKCEDCGKELQLIAEKCPYCGSTHLREPDKSQLDYFTNPHTGQSFLDCANYNGQPLVDVLRMYAELQFQNNQSYTLCITGEGVDRDTGELKYDSVLEFLCIDPKYVRYLYDDGAKPGTRYAFTRLDRSCLIDMDQDPEALNDYTDEGVELIPAYWKIGSSYGGEGEYILYTQGEVFQDHWYRPSLTYGIPVWFDIEDDLLTYHYIEKHNLKRYQFGYVRKIVLLPGFNDEDVEDITKGIQDILATNDNSIPIVCTPPSMPGVSEMRAQTLELGTESAMDLMAIKNDVRDRLCAHGGVPNMFVGDVESSGGMNNESQQITVFDRYLTSSYNYLDNQLKWILGKFPKITDWTLQVIRPAKLNSESRLRMEDIQEASLMLQMGFEAKLVDGRFIYSSEPMSQELMSQQITTQKNEMTAKNPPENRGLMPGDGEGPPEKGSARREDSEIDHSKNEIELSMREGQNSTQI